MEAYKAQNGLTQRFKCQQFRHVWANCRQPSRFLWCGGDHFHKECPDAEKENSTPNCCNCSLKEGERFHPSNYRGCSRAKRRRCGRRTRDPSPRELQWGSSPPTMSPLGSRSQWHCVVTQGSSLRCEKLSKCWAQQQKEWGNASHRATYSTNRSVSPDVQCKQYVLRPDVQGRNCRSVGRDRPEWSCSRRSKNYPKSNKTRWPL
jgi:hypothetical protein